MIYLSILRVLQMLEIEKCDFGYGRIWIQTVAKQKQIYFTSQSLAWLRVKQGLFKASPKSKAASKFKYPRSRAWDIV